MDPKWIASTGTLIKIHRLEDPKSFDPYPQKMELITCSCPTEWPAVPGLLKSEVCLQLSKDLLGPGQFKKHSSTIASAITESWRFTKLSVFRGELCESYLILSHVHALCFHEATELVIIFIVFYHTSRISGPPKRFWELPRIPFCWDLPDSITQQDGIWGAIPWMGCCQCKVEQELPSSWRPSLSHTIRSPQSHKVTLIEVRGVVPKHSWCPVNVQFTNFCICVLDFKTFPNGLAGVFVEVAQLKVHTVSINFFGRRRGRLPMRTSTLA